MHSEVNGELNYIWSVPAISVLRCGNRALQGILCGAWQHWAWITPVSSCSSCPAEVAYGCQRCVCTGLGAPYGLSPHSALPSCVQHEAQAYGPRRHRGG